MVILLKKTVKLLSSDLRELAGNIRDVKSKFDDNSQNKIILQLAEEIKKEIDNNISSTKFEDGTHDLGSFLAIKGNTITVGMKGSQAVYDEFGTGTEGEVNQHPLKSEMGLNPYNSGSTIRKANKYISDLTAIPPGEKYWTFEKGGNIYYTTGIPAGRQVYNAYRKVRKNQKSIIKKALEKILNNKDY